MTSEELKDALRETIASLRSVAEYFEAENRLLRCVECGRVADEEASGWRTFLTEDEPAVAESFCPDCAERELGDA